MMFKVGIYGRLDSGAARHRRVGNAIASSSYLPHFPRARFGLSSIPTFWLPHTTSSPLRRLHGLALLSEAPTEMSVPSRALEPSVEGHLRLEAFEVLHTVFCM